MLIARARFIVFARFVLFSLAMTWLLSANAAPLTLVVDSTGDFIDKSIGDGVCATLLNDCSLRAAIQEANANAGADTINFNIPGGAPFVIDILGTPLPSIKGGLVIDGSSQPGFAASPVVEITSGPLNSDGLVVDSGVVSIVSLAITAMDGNGLTVHADWISVDGCYLGVSINGVAAGNNGAGILLDGSQGLIGSARGNVISANVGVGIVLLDPGANNKVYNNRIGVDDAGMLALGNLGGGISIRGNDNVIGGGLSGDGNIVSGNGSFGISVSDSGTTGNIISGNNIGVNATADSALPNTNNGVQLINGSSLTTVGGPDAGDRNVISGNSNVGIIIGLNSIDASSGNHILGNYIGTDGSGNSVIPNNSGMKVNGGSDNIIGSDGVNNAYNIVSGNINNGIILRTGNTIVAFNRIGTNALGTAAVANGAFGVLLDGDNVQIGPSNLVSGNGGNGIEIVGDNNLVALNLVGTTADFTTSLGNSIGINIVGSNNEISRNGVADNHFAGIRVETGTNNLISQNAMFDNALIPVDLGTDLGTDNDVADVDTGANNLQNFPLISSAAYDPGSDQLSLRFEVDSNPANADYPLAVDVFIADAAHSEPRFYLGSLVYSSVDFSSGFVNRSVNSPLHAIQNGDFLVAQVSDAANNSSEISTAIAIDVATLPEVIFEDGFETAP